MVNFTIYDLVLLAIFITFVSIFLYRKRKNLKKEGMLFLYKTSLGIKVINYIGKKYKKTLNFLSYVSIGLGYFLMVGMIYFFYTIVRTYIFRPDIVNQIKIPPIMPLIPYIDKIVPNLNLPPFYFIYWIIIIAIIAISHEFSHGIFAVNKNVKIKSTGFGFFPFFLPVFLAAFVELDEKRMEKKKISSQMAILSAGTFANTLTAILFLGILILFFSCAFTPSGVIFDSYTYSVVSIAGISSVNGIMIENATYEKILSLTETGMNEINSEGITYIITKESLEKQGDNLGYIGLYDDAPAIKANLSRVILKINGQEVKNREQLGNELLKYSPEEKIIITTLESGANRDYEIILAENPLDNTKPYLGIGFLNKQGSGIMGKVMGVFSSFKDSNTYYKPSFEWVVFVYDLLWWIVLISFSVALVNMLPVGIFDGGRFFYLTILAITKREKVAKKVFSVITWLFLMLLFVIMFFWAKSFF
ncbi:site-2 protease family protein [Candidatus Pacearchaeota archaeon]|nr:site-2 protease family protein [Candidatus Pacearchaeota archaeon]